ncbi:MAG: hypothetical protein J2P45_08335 [Candidatus Dormibacteraeota bacterium]|nr:hypothetical protein [Candidatus Dormibacteraeota bacterium]
MSKEPEPVVGWRLWRVRQDRLMSWAVDRAWDLGENHATCLAPAGRRCLNSPGHGCLCGLWAVWNPMRALKRARDDRYERLTVLGLVVGWGEVAIHGEEGFRAERARVVCLFEDWVWRRREEEVTAGLLKRFVSLIRGDIEPPEPDPDRSLHLAQAADRYMVPLLPLREAVRVGLLAELGVSRPVIDEVKEWAEGA